MAFPLINPGLQFFDNTGEVLAGGLLYSYAPGTTTPKTTYSDENLGTPNANPIVLDSAGRCTVFLTDGEEYKFVLKTSAAVTLWTRDEIKSPSALSATSVGTVLYARTSAELAAGVTPTNYAYESGPPPDVRRFGAAGDNSANDTASAQSGQDVGSTRYPPLTYKFVAGSVSPFDFGNQTNDVFRAVQIDISGFMLEGWGATVHMTSRSGVTSNDIQPAFCTDKNMTLGTVKDLTVLGLRIDTENDADATNSNQRGYYYTGVIGARWFGAGWLSSGNRRGYGAHIQNSRDVQLIGHYHRSVTGGINFRYTNNVAIVGGVWYDFSEAIDFDGTQNRAVVVANAFESTSRANQMWDINGQVEGVFMGATAYNLGNVATIQYKDTTPPNFSDYVNNVTPSSMTPSQRVMLNGIAGSAIGSTSAASFVVGNDWTGLPHDGYASVSDIFLTNIALSDVSWVTVYEATRLLIQNMSLTNVITPASNYAVNITSQTGTDAKTEWSDLDVSITDLYINGCERGGLRINNARRASIIGARVTGINSLGGSDYAFQMSFLEARGAQVTIDHCDFDGDVNFSGSLSSIAAWAGTTAYKRHKVVSNGGKYYRCTVSGTSAGAGGPSGITSPITDGTVTWEYLSEPFRVVWGPNNRVRGQLAFSNDAHQYIHGRSLSLNLGDLSATGTVNRALYIAPRKCRIARVTVSSSVDVSADATNLRTLAFKSRRSGSDTTISSITTAAGWTAYTRVDGGFAASETGAELEPGDVFYVDITDSSAGKAITGLEVTFEVLDL